MLCISQWTQYVVNICFVYPSLCISHMYVTMNTIRCLYLFCIFWNAAYCWEIYFDIVCLLNVFKQNAWLCKIMNLLTWFTILTRRTHWMNCLLKTYSGKLILVHDPQHGILFWYQYGSIIRKTFSQKARTTARKE